MSYIEREALLSYLFARQDEDLDISLAIAKFPAADVAPVVRCWECKHLMLSDVYGECKRGYLGGMIHPNDFCSCGERKDGD